MGAPAWNEPAEVSRTGRARAGRDDEEEDAPAVCAVEATMAAGAMEEAWGMAGWVDRGYRPCRGVEAGSARWEEEEEEEEEGNDSMYYNDPEQFIFLTSGGC